MANAIDYDKTDAMGAEFVNYARTLAEPERIRLAAQLLGWANAVQQTATITPSMMAVARMETNLFEDVDSEDPMDPGYHLHNMLENVADEFDALADAMCENAALDVA